MKITLVIEADVENLETVALDAVRTAVNGGDEGTYGVGGGKGEFTLAHWPSESEECPHCCGSGYVVL